MNRSFLLNFPGRVLRVDWLGGFLIVYMGFERLSSEEGCLVGEDQSLARFLVWMFWFEGGRVSWCLALRDLESSQV